MAKTIHGEVKLKRGRQRKEDEPLYPLKRFDKAEDRNKEKYALRTIRDADRLLKQYEKVLPNPLNIDAKDLTPEAIKIWKYIYSLREGNLVSIRTFNSVEEVLIGFEAYCDYVRKQNYTEVKEVGGTVMPVPIVPNVLNFSAWLGVSRRVVHRVMMNATDYEKREYQSMLSELISGGGLVKAYDTSMAIFTLKNLCDWADKREDRIIGSKEIESIEDAKKQMAELGYTRTRLLDE